MLLVIRNDGFIIYMLSYMSMCELNIIIITDVISIILVNKVHLVSEKTKKKHIC